MKIKIIIRTIIFLSTPVLIASCGYPQPYGGGYSNPYYNNGYASQQGTYSTSMSIPEAQQRSYPQNSYPTTPSYSPQPVYTQPTHPQFSYPQYPHGQTMTYPQPMSGASYMPSQECYQVIGSYKNEHDQILPAYSACN